MYLQTFFPLIFTTYTYQIVNMQFGMYFWITTAFFQTLNTYRFVKYRFGMYLQTFFPLVFTTYTYQIVNMQFGMYFYIPTVFLIIKNTYHFVNYQYSMYLQTVLLKNFPFIHTILQFWDLVCFYSAKVPFYTYNKKSQSTFSHILHSLSLQLIPPRNVPFIFILNSEFWILNFS